MKRLLPFIFLILISCTLSKEMRQQNRAADHVEKAKRLDPSLIKGREVEIPVTLAVPSRAGALKITLERVEINADSLIAAASADTTQLSRIIRETIELPYRTVSVPFEDSILIGTFRIENGTAFFTYVIKEDSVSGTVTTITDTIEPTRHEREGLFAKLERDLRWIIYILAAMVVGIGIGKWMLK